MAITVTIDADLVTGPEVVAPSDPVSIASIAVDATSASVKGPTFTSGPVPDFASKLNNFSARFDITAQALNGVYAIIKGLDLTEGTGLNLAVAAGQAFIQGIIEIAPSSVTLAASNTNWVWLLSTGSLWAGLSGDTPDGPALFLGTVVCSGSAITAIDQTSVFWMRGGLPIRYSGDTFKPTDTPTAKCVHLVKTTGATWLWDGERYNLLIDANLITSLSGSATLSDVITRLKTLGLAL